MIAELELRPGETSIRSVLANRQQGGRAVGGRLHLTNQRVAFKPNGIDRRTGGQEWEIAPSAVVELSVAPRGRNLFNGSMRRRLQITTTSGVELFVVNKVDRLVEQLRADLAALR